MKVLLILNDPPYGTERSYNALRLAGSMVTKDESALVDVFLMGDAVACAKAGQQTPNGYYNLERMLGATVAHGAEVALCGTCMDARAIQEDQLVDGTRRSTLEELTKLSLAADRVLVF